MRNSPHRPPGRRGPPPGGVPLRVRREKGPRQTPQQRVPRDPLADDPVIAHLSARFEEAYVLQRAGENTWHTSGQYGSPLFGVSGWVVAAPAEPFPPGYARLSTLRSFGLHMVWTPHLGRKGHVTILLHDPVSPELAHRFNQAFGREPEEE